MNDSPIRPSLHDVFRILLLSDYNTRLVVLSAAILGLASGLVGAFLVLRKRSLMGDVLSHASLPGIGILFMLMATFWGNGKWLPGLLLGAVITGTAGIGLVLLIRNTTRVKDDAAMGIVLSVFFGLGVAILGMVQAMPSASAAGLESFIYGKAAAVIRRDFLLICATATVIIIFSVALLKEFTALCFDEEFTRSLGWPVHLIDAAMLTLVTAVTVIGLQAVGLILIIAFLIIPAAAARFWTNSLRRMLMLAGLIGALSGWVGASISALMPRLPTGAIIVLAAAVFFLISMFFGATRGVLRHALIQRRLLLKIGRQNFLRAVYEVLESNATPARQPLNNTAVPCGDVLAKRSWTPHRLRRLIAQARREDHLHSFDGKTISLSESGFGEAARITRNHRLWEIYLITHADVAPQHVDRGADAVEHVLGPDMVRKLEEELSSREEDFAPVPSPHLIKGPLR